MPAAKKNTVTLDRVSESDSPFEPAGDAKAAQLSDYPELEPVIALALDAVISSFYPEKIDARFRDYLQRVTGAATLAIYAPIAALTVQTGRRAQDSRVVRTAAVAKAAENIAACVAEVAAALEARDGALAVTEARDASSAADLVAASASLEGDQTGIAEMASVVASAVHDAATAAVLERARAASLIAQSATTAAAEVARAADEATVAVELEVFQAAAALRAIALETCYQVAINVAASVAEAVLADGLPD